MIKTNVCIIGAGPAGAATSLMLSKLKIHHHIIDKATFPRDKTCGDGLILYAYKALKELGLLEEFFRNPKFIHSKKIKLHIADTINFTFQEKRSQIPTISYAKRIDFDHFLVKHISKEYATCEFGNGLKNITKEKDGIILTLKDGKQIFTKMVVGAEGVQSIVSKKLGQNTIDRNKTSTFISAYFKNIKNLQLNNEAEIRIVYKGVPLFFYVFPLANGLANVSLGGNSLKVQQQKINLRNEVELIINTHLKVADKFKNAQIVGNWRGWAIPNYFKDTKVSGDNFMLVGDACGLANAFYKEGVGTGMMSGIMCAKKIKTCIEANNYSDIFLKNYKEELNNEFGKLLKFSELAYKVTSYKSLFIRLAKIFKFYVGRRAPKLIEKRSC